MAKDLRTFLVDLEKEGLLLKVKKPVDVDTQSGAVNWQAVTQYKKAVICENLAGFPGWRSFSGIMGTREIAAVALGTTVKDMTRHLAGKFREGNFSQCRMVESGPVHEVVQTGEQVNLWDLPFHVVWEGDAGRYMGSGFLVCRDPETGIRNLAVLRHQLKDKNKLGVMMVAGRHAWRIYQKYRARGQAMPVAIVNGHHGATVMASTWTTAFGVDEYEIANMLLGDPLDLVKCRTVDLEVPADAEVVIEGFIPPDVVEDEGPFGEHTGCTIAGAGLNPIINVTAVTRRSDAIFLQITEGPLTDGAVLDALPMEVQLFNRLKDVGGGIDLHRVVVHECAGGGHLVVIQMTPTVDGEVRAVLMAALSSEYLHPKIAIAVDDDVDPYQPSEVLWSMSTKVNPVQDVTIIPGTRGHSLDGSLPAISPPGVNPVIRVGSRMGIDATKPPLYRMSDREQLARLRPKGFAEVDLSKFLGE